MVCELVAGIFSDRLLFYLVGTMNTNRYVRLLDLLPRDDHTYIFVQLFLNLHQHANNTAVFA